MAFTNLHDAARAGDVGSLLGLLKQTGAREAVNKGDKLNRRPIHLAAYVGSLPAVKLLLQFGSDLDPDAQDKVTPLAFAVQKGHVDVVKELVARGADVNKANKKGKTPLMLAVGGGHTDLCEILLNAGASPTATTKRKDTVLSFAKTPELKDLLERSIAAGGAGVKPTGAAADTSAADKPTTEEPATAPSAGAGGAKTEAPTAEPEDVVTAKRRRVDEAGAAEPAPPEAAE